MKPREGADRTGDTGSDRWNPQKTLFAYFKFHNIQYKSLQKVVILESCNIVRKVISRQ